MSEEKELLDHDYDGIQEYNHSMPLWMSITFSLSIIFGVIYAIHYLSGSGPSLKEELEVNLAAHEQFVKENRPQFALDMNKLNAIAADTEQMKLANSVYSSKCQSCHGENAKGFIGPNLTDDFWLHGGSTTQVSKIILEGFLEKGMPAWKDQLTEQELYQVIAYVKSVRSSNIAGKEAQGEKQTEYAD